MARGYEIAALILTSAGLALGQARVAGTIPCFGSITGAGGNLAPDGSVRHYYVPAHDPRLEILLRANCAYRLEFRIEAADRAVLHPPEIAADADGRLLAKGALAVTAGQDEDGAWLLTGSRVSRRGGGETPGNGIRILIPVSGILHGSRVAVRIRLELYPAGVG